MVATATGRTAPSPEAVPFRLLGRRAMLRQSLAPGELSRPEAVDIVTAREVAVGGVGPADESVQTGGNMAEGLPVAIRVARTRIKRVFPA